MMKAVVLIVALFGAASAQSFQGEYAYAANQPWYWCQSGTGQLWGGFWNGFAEGQVNPLNASEATGNWWQVDAELPLGYNTGAWQIALAADDSEFNGTFTALTVEGELPWGGSRLTNDEPTALQCLSVDPLDLEGVEGSWHYDSPRHGGATGDIDLCVQQGRLYGSETSGFYGLVGHNGKMVTPKTHMGCAWFGDACGAAFFLRKTDAVSAANYFFVGNAKPTDCELAGGGQNLTDLCGLDPFVWVGPSNNKKNCYIALPQPGKPKRFDCSDQGAGVIGCTWKNSNHGTVADQFQLQYKLAGTTGFTNVLEGLEYSALTGSLAPGTYRLRIRGKRLDFKGVWAKETVTVA